jgi:hypothetical protein
MNDPVNSPSHYVISPGLEVIDVREFILKKIEAEGIVVPLTDIDDWSRAWEYLTRMWFKNGCEDAYKAEYYLDRLVTRMREREDYYDSKN